MNALYTKACELEFPVNMGANNVIVVLPSQIPAKILKWKVSVGNVLSRGRVILLYDISSNGGDTEPKKLKASQGGTVVQLLAAEGDIIKPGEPLLELEKCCHPTVMKDMCAECGADLRKDDQELHNAHVPMVHSVPELKVSVERAQILGRADEIRLLKQRKLVLLVDLDQTLIHTTNDDIPPNLKDVHHFQLHGAGSPWYHTRLRPGTHHFLELMSHLYELHICTFGSRTYAHAVAAILDSSKKFFSHRILSRDECFNPYTKTANLKALFPCGDKLVCIIDDREDVWNFAPNLVHVRPYHFFQHTGDINAPPPISIPSEEAEKNCIPSDIEGKVELSTTELKEAEKVDSKDQEDDTKDEGAKDQNKDNTKNVDEANNQEKILIEVVKEVSSEGDDELKSKSQVFQENCSFKDEGGGESTEKETVTQNVSEQTSEKDPGSLKDESKVEENASSEGSGEVTKPNTENIEVKGVGAVKDDMEETFEVDDHDDYLLHLEDILRTIHRAFYQIYDQSHPDIPDLKSVVPYVRRKVLQGVRICFSGVVPIGVPLEASRVYAVARNLGAEVTNDLVLEGDSGIDPDGEDSKVENETSKEEATGGENEEPVQNESCVDADPKSLISTVSSKTEEQLVRKPATHLVAARLGTYKVNQAKRKGSSLIVVTPDWLWCCAERWERVDERLFPLNKSTSADCIKKLKTVRNHMQPNLKETETGSLDSSGLTSQEEDGKSSSKTTGRISSSSDQKPPTVFPTYDRVTGKRVLKPSTGAIASTDDGNGGIVTNVEERRRTPSGRFMDTINPLLSFSSEDLANMEDEVEEGLSDEEEEDETESEIEGVWQEEALDFDSKQSDQAEESEISLPTKEEKISRKRKSSSVFDEDTQMIGDDPPKNTAKHFSNEEPLREWDPEESVDMEDAEEDEDDDKDWSMMGAALERGIMTEEME